MRVWIEKRTGGVFVHRARPEGRELGRTLMFFLNNRTARALGIDVSRMTRTECVQFDVSLKPEKAAAARPMLPAAEQLKPINH